MATIHVVAVVGLPLASAGHPHRTSIDVSFDQEVGERAGSWKGGTIGCDTTCFRRDPRDTIVRMERERKSK